MQDWFWSTLTVFLPQQSQKCLSALFWRKPYFFPSKKNRRVCWHEIPSYTNCTSVTTILKQHWPFQIPNDEVLILRLAELADLEENTHCIDDMQANTWERRHKMMKQKKKHIWIIMNIFIIRKMTYYAFQKLYNCNAQSNSSGGRVRQVTLLQMVFAEKISHLFLLYLSIFAWSRLVLLIAFFESIFR